MDRHQIHEFADEIRRQSMPDPELCDFQDLLQHCDHGSGMHLPDGREWTHFYDLMLAVRLAEPSGSSRLTAHALVSSLWDCAKCPEIGPDEESMDAYLAWTDILAVRFGGASLKDWTAQDMNRMERTTEAVCKLRERALKGEETPDWLAQMLNMADRYDFEEKMQWVARRVERNLGVEANLDSAPRM